MKKLKAILKKPSIPGFRRKYVAPLHGTNYYQKILALFFNFFTLRASPIRPFAALPARHREPLRRGGRVKGSRYYNTASPLNAPLCGITHLII